MACRLRHSSTCACRGRCRRECGCGALSNEGVLTLQQTAVGPPPLPGGVAAVLRFFFNLPQWFQIGGFFVGLAIAAWLLVFLWRRRFQIISWVKTRQRGVKVGLAATAAVVVLGTAGFGSISWNYMQHD